MFAATVAALVISTAASAQLTGQTSAHDPSTLIHVGNKYVYFATGQGIVSRTSNDKLNWSAGASVFATPPSWTTSAVAGFTGSFWAPDVAFFNGKYHLYYSASSWGTIDSAIGVATSPSLTTPVWTDLGKVVQSDAAWEAGPNTDTTTFNAIDPSLYVDDSTGRVWMAFGSYSSGILVTEINAATGKRLNTSSLDATLVANNTPGGGWGSSIEGASLTKRGSYYYLFVNYGGCCAGVDSTYNIRVGRSSSPTGPFLDKNGVDMRNAGGTMFLDDDGNKIGPGHFSLFSENGQDQFGYHYYDGNRNGAPTYGLHNLYWTADAWPSYAAVNPEWSGASNSNWSTLANWSNAVPDAPGAIANFKSITSNRYLVAVDGAARAVGTINFDSASTYIVGAIGGNGITLDQIDNNQATINVATGSHIIAAPLNAADQLGITVTPANSTLTLQGTISAPSLQKYGSGTLSLTGANTYSGSALIHDGAVTLSGSMITGQYMSVGAVVGDVATLRVIGNGSLTSTADLNIGDTGDNTTAATGTLELSGSGSVSVGPSGGFFVGAGFSNNTRAVGTVTQTGGTLTVTNAADGMFVIGGRTSILATGAYNLLSGAVNADTNVRVGGRGTGSVNQIGGTFNANGYVSIGRISASVGSWTISGGTLNHTNAATQIIVGEGGTGTLTIAGNGLVTTPSLLRLGQSGGAGTLNLNGGVLQTNSIVRGSGTAAVNFNGGTLRAAASNASFISNLTTALVQAGGAKIDSGGFDVTIAQPLLHDSALAGVDGGIVKLGAGELTLNGANNFTGTLRLNGGSLRLGTASRNVLTNPGGVEVNAGSLLIDGLAGDSTASTVRQLLESSYASAFVSGQIRTTVPAKALGWLSVSATQVKVALAEFGDANLDASVNFDDLLALAQNYGATSDAVWSQGDFDYDGAVTFDDLLVLAQHYGSSTGVGEGLSEVAGEAFVADWQAARSLVPEPGWTAIFTALLAAQRRIRRKTGQACFEPADIPKTNVDERSSGG
jgi:arabinan endo-1,5-alpha-L-arabinosidase